MKRENILNLKDCPNSLRDQAINAAIIAGFNFFTTLAALGATGLLGDPQTGLIAAGISAGLGFFASLFTQRGLKKTEE
jgi:hypothetical protein